jgi:hypothetical protein
MARFIAAVGGAGLATIDYGSGSPQYIPYPTYFAEQLTSKIIEAGGKVVQAMIGAPDPTAYAVVEPNGHLDPLVINNPAGPKRDHRIQCLARSSDNRSDQRCSDFAASPCGDKISNTRSLTTMCAPLVPVRT